MGSENAVADSVERISDRGADVISRDRGVRETPRVLKSAVIDERIDENSSVEDIQKKSKCHDFCRQSIGV